jgi:hypothetical protein
MTCEQYRDFRDIQIYNQTQIIPSSVLQSTYHALFRGTHFALKTSETYNLTVGSSRLLWNYCHPILKPVCPLSILRHFFEFLSRIVGLAGSRNIQFLIVVSCARALLQLAITNYI